MADKINDDTPIQSDLYDWYDHLSDSRQKYLLMIVGLALGFIAGILF